MFQATNAARRKLMAAVKSKNTQPEMVARRFLHSVDYRFRVHDKNLPGRPDIVFLGKRKAIFVNGCFWHGHHCNHGKIKSRTNEDFWSNKIRANIQRDEKNDCLLNAMGWKTLTIWECQIKQEDWISPVLKFLEGD